MPQLWLQSYLKHILLNLLSSPEIKLASQHLHISNHLDMIRDSLWALNAVIVDACVRALKESKLKKWLQDVSIVAASIEDILEGLQEEQKQEVTPPPNLLHHYSISCTSTLFLSSHRHAILVELKQIAQSLNCLLSRAVAFGLLIDMINSMDPNQAEYYSILQQEVVGRDDDVMRILQIIFQLEEEQLSLSRDINDDVKRILQIIFQLKEEQLSRDINDDVPFVIAITGKEGVGKSILARMIYHHPLVCEFFKHRIWVDVSNCVLYSFQHRQIARECIRHLTKKTSSDVDIWSLIHSSLPQTRCLLILDGIIHLTRENKDKWVELKKNLLSSSAPGSRVIITCESYDIFENNQMVHSDKVYKLSNIAEDEMTKLVLRYYKSITQCDRLEQNSSSIEMTDMLHLACCDRIPLVIKIFCSIMGHFNVQYKKLEAKHTFYCILMARFHDKYAAIQVFRYIALFRPLPLSLFKDCIDMLITEGAFTCSRKAQQTYRKVIIEKINSFSKEMNLLYPHFHKNVHHIWKRGGQESRIPQLCRYLCMLIESQTGNFLSDLQARSPNNLRTLILYKVKKEMDLQLEDNQVASSIEIPKSLIKSLVILSIIDIGIQQLPSTIGMLLCLRYLNLSEKKIHELPESICDLRNLRVLSLSHCKKLMKLPEQIHNLGKLQMLKLGYCSRLQKLPKSITSLLNLQVLDVEACYWLNELPEDLRQLERLMSLHIIGCASLTQMPTGISKLTNLEALSGYKIDYDGERSTLEELQTLTNIEQLHIHHLELLVNLSTIKSVNLEEKQYLVNLLLHWEWWNMVERANDQLESFEVLDGLKPNVSNLERLEIISYMGEKIPNWITPGLPSNLVELRLINLKRCKKLQLLSPDDSLESLEVLEVSGMDSLAYVGVEEEYLDRLRYLKMLTLSEMPILEHWSFHCPRLKEVTLIHCPKLKIVSIGLEKIKLTVCLQSMISEKDYRFLGDNYLYVEELEIIGCHDLCSLHQVFPSLRSLSIIECSKLQSLPDWLQEIHSLEHISVVRCKAISYIPEQLKDRIIIRGCPKLQALTKKRQAF